jgi:hypothetical protein
MQFHEFVTVDHRTRHDRDGREGIGFRLVFRMHEPEKMSFVLVAAVQQMVPDLVP